MPAITVSIISTISTVRSAELAVSNAQLAYSRTVVQDNLSAAQLLANLDSGSARVTL